MPRVLFLAYDFQPCENPGGSIRSTKFVEMLPSFGWQPSVLSVTTSEASVEGEMLENVSRVKSLTPYSQPYQIKPYGWVISLLKEADRILKDQPHDLIYVSCPPFPPALAGVVLKRRYNLPLVVDFRDAWSLNPYQGGSRMSKLINQYLVPRGERTVLRHADKLVLNTPSMLRGYQQAYPQFDSRMTLIPNGFDERDFAFFTHWNSSDSLELLYVGRFGTAGRDATPLFQAIKQLNQKKLHIKLSLVGSQPEALNALIKKMAMESMVTLEGGVDHAKAVARMSACDVLVLFQEMSKAPVQAVAGKTYEYLRAGKPILSIAPSGDNQDLIAQYSINSKQVTSTSSADIAAALRGLYQDWEGGVYTQNDQPNPEYIKQYDRLALTRQLAEVFNAAL